MLVQHIEFSDECSAFDVEFWALAFGFSQDEAARLADAFMKA